MSTTRKDRVPMSEQLKLINQCRQSGQNLDNSHTIEISIKELKVRINNNADPVLLSKTLHLIKEFLC